MQWTDDVKIETPEQIDVSLEIAGLGSRFVAQLYDWLAKWGLLVLVGAVAAIVLGLLGTNVETLFVQKILLMLVVALVYAFLVGWDIYYEVRHNGQTPGKRMAGIRAIREGGAPLDFRTAALRNLLGIADFLPGFYLLGAFLIQITPRGQRLGDLAAGTIVIRERAAAAPGDDLQVIDHLASDEFAFTAQQLGHCSRDDRYILRSFFQRYQQMEADARQQLAARLAEQFLRKTAYQPQTPVQEAPRTERFLASLYRDLQNQARHGR